VIGCVAGRDFDDDHVNDFSNTLPSPTTSPTTAYDHGLTITIHDQYDHITKPIAPAPPML